MLRTSATVLEAFRLWSDPEQEWMSEADLQATIRGEFTPNRPIMVGLALGKIVENPDKYRVDGGYECRGVFFPDTFGGLAIRWPGSAFEVRMAKVYGDVLVVSKADQVVGSRIIEHKATSGTFNFEKYAESAQWRFMADALQPDVITYHVCLVNDDEDTGDVTIRDIETFNLYPYPELHRDCCDLVERFLAYVRARGLVTFLEEQQQRWGHLDLAVA